LVFFEKRKRARHYDVYGRSGLKKPAIEAGINYIDQEGNILIHI
jgi:hypothetical protein